MWGDCSSVRRCPKGWYAQNHPKAGATTCTKAAPAKTSLKEGRRIPPPSARTIRVLDLTDEVKPVSPARGCTDVSCTNDTTTSLRDLLTAAAGTGGFSMAALGERSLEGLWVIGQLCRC